MEDLLASAVQAAPQQHQRVKLAERALPLGNDLESSRGFVRYELGSFHSQALRLYYHAKWLAERNHATAAEWRYREARSLQSALPWHMCRRCHGLRFNGARGESIGSTNATECSSSPLARPSGVGS